jgi:hypothetical protein
VPTAVVDDVVVVVLDGTVVWSLPAACDNPNDTSGVASATTKIVQTPRRQT